MDVSHFPACFLRTNRRYPESKVPMRNAILASAAVGLVVFIAGCSTNDAPPLRCALLADTAFCCAIDDCSRRRHEPLSTGQIVAFVGEPDVSVSWSAVTKTLAAQTDMDSYCRVSALEHMRQAYAFGKDLDAGSHPMDGVEVWLYMWKKPDPLFVSGLIRKPAGAMSIAVLVENDRVIGISSIHRSVKR